ncbi:MAG: multicopper oxidase domain-containing protein [Deltaproteobacteria bacterium]|nr:multicopper oxidase domain-containing protein [Deltaproteobacteria bacterium]
MAFYGQGVPLDTVATGTDLLVYPAPVAPISGSTITLGVDPGYPIYPQARNYALAATVDVVTGTTTTLVGGIRKFVDGLPGLTAAGANGLGQYIPVAVADTASYPGSDFYEIGLVEYQERMHSDLPPTRLRGYVQLSATGPVALTNVDGSPVLLPDGTQARSLDTPHYLGPAIVAVKDHPVRIKFRNLLPTGAAGNLFVPVDETVMGAGTGPKDASGADCDNTIEPNNCAKYPQNRATLHLHGGHTPWISDGTPHQWITPSGEITPFKKGVSVFDVPDMPAEGDGSQTFYWTNQQSSRLMFYHDHAYGITRLNVYVGEAAAYVITDPVEQELVAGGILPTETIPLVIQDKTFVDADAILATDPTWRWGTGALGADPDGTGPWKAVPLPKTGDLWYPHVYVPAQNPFDLSGANPFGRWHYGPWFWPPTTGITHGPVPNPYYDPINAPFQPPEMPGLPHPSTPGESFFDVAMVNGTAYPTITVDPKAVRFRILNAANDRFWNLQLYVAADKNSPTTAGTTGAVLCDTPASVPANCTEVKMVDAAATAFNTAANPTWPVDGRAGGVPDPATKGPSFIQFATEGGFLPAPVVVENQPVVWNANPTTFNFGNISAHALLVAPAERADVVVDFSAYAGKTLILYNDAPAAFPALDPRYDYYTGAPDMSAATGDGTGGAAGVTPGYGPNTRTIMQIVVRPGTPAPYNLTALEDAFRTVPATATTPEVPGVFKRAQDPVIVAQGDIAGRGAGMSAYDTAYGARFPFAFPYWGISRIGDTSIAFQGIDGTYNPPLGTGLPLVNGQLQGAKAMEPKAIQDEMGEVFDPDYGRMSSRLGLELRNTNAQNQNFVTQTYTDAPTEIIRAVPLVNPATDANDAQIWKITHNGVDTHPIHFHLFEVQLINRVGWDGAIRLPDANELGWKDTIRISPLEDTIVALRFVGPKTPFGIPDSNRPMSPATPLGSPMGLTNIDPFTGQPLNPPPVNAMVNFSWEYVWHCHILSHEEMDMMRAVTVLADRILPAAPVLAAAGTGPVALTWTDATPAADPATAGNPANEVGFRVERADGLGGAFAVIGQALANATGFTDPTAVSTGYYQYRVAAYNALGDSFSNVVAVGTPPPVPAIPTNLSARIVSATRIDLTWTDASTDETQFLVYRSTNGGPFVQIGSLARTAAQSAATGVVVSFRNNGNTPGFTPAVGNTYAYYVTAANGIGSSNPTATVTVNFRIPAAPSAVTGLAVRIPGNNTQDAVTLTWTDNADNETSFQVQRSTSANFTNPTTYNLGANVTQFLQNVSRNNDYSYRVRARNALGNSAWAVSNRVDTP